MSGEKEVMEGQMYKSFKKNQKKNQPWQESQ